MSRFVIIGSDGFYTGEHYTNQGERFAIFDKNIHREKYYSTFKRAQSARKKMQGALFFGETKIKEILENGKLI